MPDTGSTRTEELAKRARFIAAELKRQGIEAANEAVDRAITPRRLERHIDGATRTGQVVAFFFLGPIIVASLPIIVVLNQLMTDLLGVRTLTGGQDPIFAWLVTAITGGALIVAAWAWFQFVRTAGFGAFSLD